MSFVLHDWAYRQIKAISDRLTRDANAKVVFLVDKNGLLIAASGDDIQNIDTTSLASLAAGNIAARVRMKTEPTLSPLSAATHCTQAV